MLYKMLAATEFLTQAGIYRYYLKIWQAKQICKKNVELN